jgi:hypothetical protein
MSIGGVAFNDPVANFFKAVETARQRNNTGFEKIQPMAQSGSAERAQAQKAAAPLSMSKQYEPKPMGVNTAPAVPFQGSRQVRTKILGNYFDAYA